MLRIIKHLSVVIESRAATVILKPILAPVGEVLSFASPNYMDVLNAENAGAQSAKESFQRKGDLDAVFLLHSIRELITNCVT